MKVGSVMALVLVKRDDGTAAILGAVELDGGSHYDIERAVSGDDIVDGKPVSAWPAGVHPLPDEMLKSFVPELERDDD